MRSGYAFRLSAGQREISLVIQSSRFPQGRDKGFFILCDSLLDFPPSIWAILVLHADYGVDYFVEIPFVLSRNQNASSLKDRVEMPKVARQIWSPRLRR